MGALFPAVLFAAFQLQHGASVVHSQWDHFDALNNLDMFHRTIQSDSSANNAVQETQEATQANETVSTSVESAPPVIALDELETIPAPSAPSPPPPAAKPILPLTPLEPLTPAKKSPSEILIELGTSTKRSAMTLGMSAAAEAREQLRSLSSERDYYSQQYAGELSRSSALAQRLQMVQAELTQEQEKEKQESDDHARHLQALQAQVESDQKDMSYQAAWVVQARDKKLQGVQSDAALWKNRSLALEQELKEVRTANKLEKAKEVGMSTKIADLQRQNDALIVDQQDHDQEVNKSQSNLEYAQRQTRQVEKALKQSKQHSLALEAKLQLLQGAQQDWTREHLQDQQDNARLQKILKNAGAYTDRRIQGVITRASKMALGFQSSEQAWVAKEQHFQASLLQANNRIESLQSHLKKQSQKLADEKDQVKKAHAEIKTLHKKAQDLESDADSRQGLEENVDDLEQQNHALENALHTAQTDGGSSRQQLAELQEQNLELSRDLEAAKLQLKHQGAGKYQLALIDLSSGGNTGTKDTNPEAEVNDLFQNTNIDPLGSLAASPKSNMQPAVARGTSFLDVSRSISTTQGSQPIASNTAGGSGIQGSQIAGASMPGTSVTSVADGVAGDALSEVEQLLH